MKTYCLGDIHSNFKALKQCLERSNFNYIEDTLIVLGDVVDGYPDTYLVVEELLKIKNLIFILGNHDAWFMDFISRGYSPNIWVHQGGAATLLSYNKELNKKELEDGSVVDEAVIIKEIMIPVTHQEFFNNYKLYYELDNMLFIHGGFDDNIPIHMNKTQTILWDRMIIEVAKTRNIKKYDKVFIGHSATKSGHIEKYNNLYCCDSGAGYKGRLSMINVYTDEVFESDYFDGHNKYNEVK